MKICCLNKSPGFFTKKLKKGTADSGVPFFIFYSACHQIVKHDSGLGTGRASATLEAATLGT